MKKILPREKALMSGIRSLTDEELLALILSTGTKNKSVFTLSADILKEFSLTELSSMPVKVLSKVEGIGKAKVLRLEASFEIGRRIYNKNEDPFDRKHLRMVLYEISKSRKEQVVLFMYDGAGFHIKTEIIAIGSLNTVMIHPREIFEPIFKHSASQFILAHNHPNGSSEPSREDIELTEEIKSLAERLELNFIESFVVSKNLAYGILNGLTMEI